MLQCSLWDKIREVSNLLQIQITNLAKFTGNIILERGLPISVLKVISYTFFFIKNQSLSVLNY